MTPIGAAAMVIGAAYVGLVVDGQFSANSLKLKWSSTAQNVSGSADSAVRRLVQSDVANVKVNADATTAAAASASVDSDTVATARALATFPNKVPMPGMLVQVDGLKKRHMELNGEQCQLINRGTDKDGLIYWTAHCWNAPIESKNTTNNKYFNLREKNMTCVGMASDDIAAGSDVGRFKAGTLIQVVNSSNIWLFGQQCMLIDSADGPISWNAYCPDADAPINGKHQTNGKIFDIRTEEMSFLDEAAPFLFKHGVDTYRMSRGSSATGAFYKGWKVLVTHSDHEVTHSRAYFQVCTLKDRLQPGSRQWRVQCGKETGDFLGLFPVRTTTVWEENMLLLVSGLTSFPGAQIQAGMIVKVGGSVSSMYSPYIGAECKVLAAASDSQGLDAWMVECSSAGMRNNETQDNVIVLRAEHMTYVSWPESWGVA